MTALTLDYLLARRIAVLGVGINNQALVTWLLKHKARSVTICDQNPAVRLANPAWEQAVTWRLGGEAFSHLTDFDLVIRSPGIPYLSPLIQQAKAAGVEISSQTKLFFALSPAKIIGVTGTKGKGTTASLIAAIMDAEVKSQKSKVKSEVYLAGNIGRDPFEFLDDLTPLDWVVLELSSFQLQDMEKSPEIAVVLDITSDHLDHHRDRDEYVAAKVPIVAHLRPEQAGVFNFDSDTVLGMVSQTSGEDWYFSRRSSVDRGAYVRWEVTPAGARRHGRLIFRDRQGRETDLLATTDLRLRGEHNLENVTAAITAATIAGANTATIRTVVPNFPGLEHRLELVATVEGRTFYNDSFATNPEPVMAALASFHEPVHLLVGGSSKQADFTALGKMISERSTTASVIPLGTVEGPRIAAAVAAANPPDSLTIFPASHSMEEGVMLAYRLSKPGEVILLSPGCASFDLFPNYKERGYQFKRLVERLKIDAGMSND